MPTIYVPRVLGGTLILTTGGPTSPVPTMVCQVTFRDGETKAKFRDGETQTTFRDGQAKAGGR